MNGKTIERVEKRDHGYKLRLHFTDGTAADFLPEGYEVEGVEVQQRSVEDLERERVEAIQKAYRDQAERERRARRREAKRAEMEALLTPSQYERWLRERDTAVGFAAVMQAEYIANLKQQHESLNRMFNGGQSS